MTLSLVILFKVEFCMAWIEVPSPTSPSNIAKKSFPSWSKLAFSFTGNQLNIYIGIDFWFLYSVLTSHSLCFCSFRTSLETKNVSYTTLNLLTLWVLVPFKLILELDFRRKTSGWDSGWVYVEPTGQFREIDSSVESVINVLASSTLLDILIFCRFLNTYFIYCSFVLLTLNLKFSVFSYLLLICGNTVILSLYLRL